MRPSVNLFGLLMLILVLIPGTASADKYDINYNRLANVTANANGVTVQKNEGAFENLVRDIGIGLAKFMGPASTLGALGFDVAYEIGFTDINETEDYWTDALDGESADSMLTTSQLHIRKGPPFSMEIGGTSATSTRVNLDR